MEIQKDNTILLDKTDVLDLCKPGESSNTCIWLMVGPEGFECHYYNRSTGLVERWCNRLTVAERDGCDKVKDLGLETRYTEAHTLEDLLEGHHE